MEGGAAAGAGAAAPSRLHVAQLKLELVCALEGGGAREQLSQHARHQALGGGAGERLLVQ